MKKHGHILISLTALALALTLFPFAAPAAAEDMMESAPEVALQAETPAEEPQAQEE